MADILTRTEFDTRMEQAIQSQEDVEIEEGWYCIRTDSFPCPAVGCDFVAFFMTGAHLIIVWPSDDDPKLLRCAHEALAVGRNPRIVEYKAEFGTAFPYDLWRALGGPVHGKLDPPSGYPPPWAPS